MLPCTIIKLPYVRHTRQEGHESPSLMVVFGLAWKTFPLVMTSPTVTMLLSYSVRKEIIDHEVR